MTHRKTKCQSGSLKAKKRKRVEQLQNSLRGSMNKYLARTSDSVGRSERINEEGDGPTAETMNDGDEEYANLVNEMEKENDMLNGSSITGPSGNNQDVEGEEFLLPTTNENEHRHSKVQNKECGPVNIYDPGNWKFIDQGFRDFLVEKGPIRVVSEHNQYPYNEHRRRFSNRYFKQKMSNGERVDRRWIVYSTVKDHVFYFSCKLFKGDGVDCQLDTNGYNDWHNLGKKLRQHDTCEGHIESISKWNELGRRLKKKETIDKAMQK
ncbi:zinc finger MYM-type protein 5-like [Papaver somniferum]|uniref:zinc finger MYM-type protein 5-like n=1 Tax=Papaver somniferum TaxID=3469 RepID=UPI000E7035C5|nr:zinc finger MYM-type protein 5-like [Papaver somniferum]